MAKEPPDFPAPWAHRLARRVHRAHHEAQVEAQAAANRGN